MTPKPQSEPLDDRQVEALADAMRAMRDDLRAQDRDSEEARAPVELDQQSIGRLSRMDAIQQQAMAEAEARRRRLDLTRIDAALDRIQAGEYGWCDVCGEPIGARRLQVDPMATRCIACAD